jgi:hypothetical protein
MLRPTPIRPGDAEEGMLISSGIMRHRRDCSGGGLRASGRGIAKGRSLVD